MIVAIVADSSNSTQIYHRVRKRKERETQGETCHVALEMLSPSDSPSLFSSIFSISILSFIADWWYTLERKTIMSIYFLL